VDDVHLAREEDAALLLEVRRRLSGAPFLLVLAGRSGAGGELPAAAPGDRGATTLAEEADLERLHLGPLAPEALYQVLEARSRAAVPSEVASRIAERSGGNPRLALDLLRHLVEAGALVPEERALRAAPGWDAVPLPQRFHEVVEARLAGLEEEDRTILEAAAVDGMDFDGRAVAAATGLPLIDVLRRLQRLVRRGGIVRPREDGYRFAHASVRDVLYESLAPELRREVHRSLAEHLDSRGAGVDPARLAAHWEGAGDADRAAPLFLEAAFASGRRQELRRTAESWDRARCFVEGLAPVDLAARGKGLLVVALCLQSVGRMDESNRLLDRLVEATWAAGDRELESRARVWRTALNFRRRGLARGEEEELRHAALADGPPERSRGYAALVLGIVSKRGGDLEAARDWFLRAQGDFQALPTETEEARVIEELGSVSLRRGEKEEAERLYAEAARMYRRLGRRSNAAVADVNRARAARMRGVLVGVDAVLESAVRTLSLEGNHPQAAHAQVLLAETYASLGRIPEGLETIERSVTTLRGLGYLPGLAGALVTKTLLCAEAGRIEEALAAAAEAGSAVEKHGDTSLQANHAAAEAIALVLAGRRPEAEAAAAGAIEFQRGTSELPTETVALLAEAVAFGLPAPCLAAADPLIPGDFEKREPVVAALRRGVLALADPKGTPEDLEIAAGVLAADFVSEKRAGLRILGKVFGAEARRRRGDGRAADEQASSAIDEARALGLKGLASGLRARPGSASTIAARKTTGA
jgi:tetratricopeptide (TPR) repeat protein